MNTNFEIICKCIRSVLPYVREKEDANAVHFNIKSELFTVNSTATGVWLIIHKPEISDFLSMYEVGASISDNTALYFSDNDIINTTALQELIKMVADTIV